MTKEPSHEPLQTLEHPSNPRRTPLDPPLRPTTAPSICLRICCFFVFKLVLKGVYHYWTYCLIFSRGLKTKCDEALSVRRYLPVDAFETLVPPKTTRQALMFRYFQECASAASAANRDVVLSTEERNLVSPGGFAPAFASKKNMLCFSPVGFEGNHLRLKGYFVFSPVDFRKQFARWICVKIGVLQTWLRRSIRFALPASIC